MGVTFFLLDIKQIKIIYQSYMNRSLFFQERSARAF